MLWILRMAFRRRSAPPRRAEAELSEQVSEASRLPRISSLKETRF